MKLTLPLSLIVLLLAREAGANEIPCSPVEPGTIQFDGLLNDWKGVDGVAVDQESQIVKGKENWSGADDLSFEVYCNHDDKTLYLALDVRDEYFIRTAKKGAAGDDHIIVHFTGKQLVVYPGDLRGIPGRISWGKAGKAKGVQMAEAMQKHGYSVELGIPLKSIPGYRAGVPSIPGAVWVADSDSKAKGQTETIMATAASAKQGSFSFAQAKADLTAFLKDKGYSAKDIRAKINADVVGDSRQEQVLLAGKTIGVVGDGVPGGGYVFLDIGVPAKDIYWLKVMDINGDGKGELITRYAERGRNGRRELLAVYRLDDSGKFTRPFAHEILKGQGERVITNRYVLKPRKRKGKKKAGVDFLVDKPAAKGFTAETYQESPAADCFPILLPWGETKKRAFRFDGDEIQEL
jgi:hypothetical protein